MTAAMEISAARARVNVLRWWWRRHIGWWGWLFAAALLGHALLSWALLPSIAAAQREQLHAQLVAMDLAARTSVAGVPRLDPRDKLRNSFPSVSRRGESISLLLDLLRQGQVAADSADYRAEEVDGGLVRLRITLPVSGGYLAIRQLIARILDALPHAALDGLALERPTDSGDRIGGQLRWSLYLRQESP